jgi:hypothetical protein
MPAVARGFAAEPLKPHEPGDIKGDEANQPALGGLPALNIFGHSAENISIRDRLCRPH